MKNFSFSFLIYFFLLYFSYALDSKLKVYYSGFSFSNTYESNKNFTKYTKELIKEKNLDTGIDIISSQLLQNIKQAKFDKINLDTYNLLDFSKYPDEAIVMSVALQHEEYAEEFNYSSQK